MQSLRFGDLRINKTTLIYPGVLTMVLAMYFKSWFIAVPGIVMAVYPALGIDISDSIYSPSFQRRTAWILLALSIAEAITGFGAGPTTSSIVYSLTFGALTRGLSLQLHILLIAPLSLFFILHIASGIGLALIRRRITWKPLYTYVIPSMLIALFVITMYLYSLLVII
ncbi:hypothetical protein [Vulcanisaeta souniana]|uniref:Uncharacterized protein n=1 Tax=Vulcanisaeta souniana JCM 11219 TaxID=1293586 RepID=A0A830EHX1_9CREN|nr:hypothetical protein [Vulcanisaeta souniana]BDR91186.1 hypothetical protein Vsou_02790 [Vulcanisaeta souniana JCM 11219]GGI86476.1 hypothetical protein GCM10007112_24310 [Vulcanisaeta souniana JCM 11219]